MNILSRSFVVLLCFAAASLLPLSGQESQGCRPMDHDATARFLPGRVPLEMETIPVDGKHFAALQFADQSRIAIARLITTGYDAGIRDRYQYVFVSETRFYLGPMLVPAGMVGIALQPVDPDAQIRKLVARDFTGTQIQAVDLQRDDSGPGAELAFVASGYDEFVLWIGSYRIDGRRR